MNEVKDQIPKILNSLVDSFTREEIQSFESQKNQEAVKVAISAVEDLNPDRFHILYTFKQDEVIRGLLNAKFGRNHKAHFIFQNYSFLSSHVRRVIDDNEGLGCAADKVRFLIRSILKFYADGTKLSLDMTKEYTYHYPTKVFLTHEDLQAFVESVMDLYYGANKKYLALHSEWTARGILI